MAAVCDRRDEYRIRVGPVGRVVSRDLPASHGRSRRSSLSTMDFVLVLHSHLPYVLNHGRWPHGSDWLCEAAVDTYLPLYETLSRLARDGVPAPITLGITPVLANQLASPAFADELERFFAQRLEHCREAIPSLKVNDANLLPLVEFWEQHLGRLRRLFRSIDRNLAAAFKALEERGIIELIS